MFRHVPLRHGHAFAFWINNPKTNAPIRHADGHLIGNLINRAEARIHDPAVPTGEYALALHRIYLTQTRLQRSISSTIADLERYRHLARYSPRGAR